MGTLNCSTAFILQFAPPFCAIPLMVSAEAGWATIPKLIEANTKAAIAPGIKFFMMLYPSVADRVKSKPYNY
jgi:hypothetical protein